MFCRYCGGQIPDDSRFCPKCGKALAEGGGTPPRPEQDRQDTQAEAEKKANEAWKAQVQEEARRRAEAQAQEEARKKAEAQAQKKAEAQAKWEETKREAKRRLEETLRTTKESASKNGKAAAEAFSRVDWKGIGGKVKDALFFALGLVLALLGALFSLVRRLPWGELGEKIKPGLRKLLAWAKAHKPVAAVACILAVFLVGSAVLGALDNSSKETFSQSRTGSSQTGSSKGSGGSKSSGSTGGSSGDTGSSKRSVIEIKCTKCHGETTVECSQCDGEGGKYITDNSTPNYAGSLSGPKVGKTWEKCRKCDGTGSMTCPRCNGSKVQ